jgi:hypothetical protein
LKQLQVTQMAGTASNVAFYYNGDNLIDILTTAPYVLSWADVADGAYNVTAKRAQTRTLIISNH